MQRIDHLYPYCNSSMTQRKHPWALLSASRPKSPCVTAPTHGHGVQSQSERACPYVRDLSTLLEPGPSCVCVHGMVCMRSDLTTPSIHTRRPPLHFSSSKKPRIRDE